MTRPIVKRRFRPSHLCVNLCANTTRLVDDQANPTGPQATTSCRESAIALISLNWLKVNAISNKTHVARYSGVIALALLCVCVCLYACFCCLNCVVYGGCGGGGGECMYVLGAWLSHDKVHCAAFKFCAHSAFCDHVCTYLKTVC